MDSATASGRLVELHHSGPVGRLPGAVAVAAQRIASEALSNAVRHAAATRISVSPASEADALTVTGVPGRGTTVVARLPVATT